MSAAGAGERDTQDHGGGAHVASAIERAGVVAVIRLPDAALLRRVIDAIADGGVRAIEVTMTVPRAIEMIAELASALPAEVLLGAGTVLDADTARRAIDAGAQFVVSPVYRERLGQVCRHRDRAFVPGCFSPTEILNAWDGGADIVKVFPATSLGPAFIRDIRAPLPQVKLMPTGGVSVENAGEWIRAGACAVGVGSALVDPRSIATGRYPEIAARARNLVAAVRAARDGHG